MAYIPTAKDLAVLTVTVIIIHVSQATAGATPSERPHN